MRIYQISGGPGRFSTLNDVPVVVGIDDVQVSWGKGYTLQQRRLSCAGEIMERAIRRSIQPQQTAAFSEIQEIAIDPRSLGVELPDELPDEQNGLEIVSFNAFTTVGWVAVDQGPGGLVRYMHWPVKNMPAFYSLNSNGAAVHTTAENAERSAALELIERDAFLRWWYGIGDAVATEVREPRWRNISDWLESSSGWKLEAYILRSAISVPVVMAVARLEPQRPGESGAIIVGTAAADDDHCGTCNAAVEAALEVVQFWEAATANLHMGSSELGDCERYFTPAGVADVVSRLPKEPPRSHNCERDTFASELEFFIKTCWYLRRSISVNNQRWHFRQAFSTQTLPFTLPGKGYRFDHPVLNELVARGVLRLESLPRQPHPLG